MTEPVQDRQTVSRTEESSQPLPADVTFHAVISKVEERGIVCQHFDPRWGWHPDPLVFAYSLTTCPLSFPHSVQPPHPDEYRLALDIDQIPDQFENPRSW